jgi:hypothetical protein
LNKGDTRLGKGRIFRNNLRTLEEILGWNNILEDENVETYNRTIMAVQSEKEITQTKGPHST